jgi:hypothetical protein
MPWKWLQIKGDPSVRRFLFQQSRVESLFDARLDEVHAMTVRLLNEKGVFHAKLHYSSSQLTCWLCDDPYRYQVFIGDEVASGAALARLPDKPLRDHLNNQPVVVPSEAIDRIMAEFKRLRMTDDSVYLRNASINRFNGIVGMTFSCDGAHYLSYTEFLDKLDSFGSGGNG